MRIAAIDVGSNSIHMVVAQVEPDGRFRVLDRAKERVRLGARTLATGKLSDEAMDAGIRTLSAFKTLAERQGAARIQAVATAAVREASNGGDFVQRVKDETGLRVQVIPGREEARLIYLGVAHAIDLRHEPALIVDAGGGSVELVRVDQGEATALFSVKLGVTRLSEKFLDSDPPTSRQLKALEEHVESILDVVFESCGADKPPVTRMIATSGSLLNVVAMTAHARGEDPEGHLNQLTATAAEIAKLRRLVQKGDRQERLKLPGLDAKRVDLIIPAACLADTILRRWNIEQVMACTWALREGVLLDFIARHPRLAEADEFPDPRRRSVARLLRQCGESGEHGSHVCRLARQLFKELHKDLDLDEPAAELLDHAALLHDVGHHISHQDHQRHAHYLITNAEMLGFQRDEVEIIALLARYHRKAAPKDDDPDYTTLAKPQKR
ncbi:MAG TPA: Ppx/GppA phosphatase family protein, partial [Terriglobales bacterium]|nr:Ppx/GppA phosphatase family protein [Terriglobales bacterium]